MKKKNLIALFVSVGLVLVLVLSGCGPVAEAPTTPAAPTTPTEPTTPTSPQIVEKVVDKTYRVLNPTGNFIPVECMPLAERLSTMDGKTIYFNESEANPRIMPALLARLKQDYTKTTFNYVAVAGFGDSTPTADVLANANAVIRGISW